MSRARGCLLSSVDGASLSSDSITHHLGELSFSPLQKGLSQMALLTFTLTHGGVGAHKTPTWVSSYSIPPVVYNPALLYVHVNQEGLEYICLGGGGSFM